jgi:hypothetical protein
MVPYILSTWEQGKACDHKTGLDGYTLWQSCRVWLYKDHQKTKNSLILHKLMVGVTPICLNKSGVHTG